MKWLTKYDRHADLSGRMADSLGVDLTEKLMRSEIHPQDLRNSVLRCMGCSDPMGCADWLDANANGADETPDYCRNKAILEGLRHAH